jgi:hypothetical protein
MMIKVLSSLRNNRAGSADYYPFTNVYLEDSSHIQLIDQPSSDPYIILISFEQVSNVIFDSSGNQKSVSHKKTILSRVLTDQIIDDLRKNKAKLVITNDLETRRINDVLTVFCQFLDLDVPKDSLAYWDSNFNIERLLNYHGYVGYYYNWVDEIYPELTYNNILPKVESLELRDKKFLFLGGKPRRQRVDFLKKCFESVPTFENNSFISIGANSMVGKKTLDVEEQWYYQQEQPKPVPWDKCYNKINYDYHYNSYWHIVTTTQFYYDMGRISINEKHFRSIVALQPFIILGEPQTLVALKEMGYKTFDKWIDESYDNELSDDARMNKIVKVIDYLNNKTPKELSVMMREMLPVLIHNATHYYEKASNNIVRSNLEEFFKNYHKKFSNL